MFSIIYILYILFINMCTKAFLPCLIINFFFCIGVELVNNVVVVSGEPQRDSAISIYASVLPQTPLPSKLPQH